MCNFTSIRKYCHKGAYTLFEDIISNLEITQNTFSQFLKLHSPLHKIIFELLSDFSALNLSLQPPSRDRNNERRKDYNFIV